MTLVFTICSNNYLAQANLLGKSLLKFNPNYKFIIGLVDKKNADIPYDTIPFEIIEVEKIGVEAFNEMFKRYGISELNTAVKPYFFRYFFDAYTSYENFIYLDPDILVYNNFEELEKQLASFEIILTPHFTTPINDDFHPTENAILNAGLYNLGFLALKRGFNSNKLINWWARQLETKAYVDFEKGMFTDQIWLNFAPLYFEKVLIFNHPGYNMAYWNLHERFLNQQNEVIKNEKNYPLVFYHFSGFKTANPELISSYQNRYNFSQRQDIRPIFENYILQLSNNKHAVFSKFKCYYFLEKQKLDLANYIAYKKAIPIYKRIFRGLTLRFIKSFKINSEYYTH